MRKIRRENNMLHIMKDDFDENAEDILNTINKMLSKSKEKTEEEETIKDKNIDEN